VDARPLPVGACSKDQDARPGHVYGGFARGYKLHAIVTANGRTLSWAVTSLPVSEAKAAQAMVAEAKPRGLLVADASYDRAPLYEAVAEHGGRLLAVPLKGAGQGHRKQSEERLSSLFLWRRIGPVMRRKRVRIECSFGNQSMYGGGLGPLPAWVRTLERVRRWVGAKLIIHHARLAVKRAAA
jgi:IS5 family transposase